MLGHRRRIFGGDGPSVPAWWLQGVAPVLSQLLGDHWSR